MAGIETGEAQLGITVDRAVVDKEVNTLGMSVVMVVVLCKRGRFRWAGSGQLAGT